MGHDEVHSGVDSFHQPWEEEADVIGPFSRLQPTQWRRAPWWGRGSCPTLTPVPPIVSPFPCTHGDCSLHRGLSPLTFTSHLLHGTLASPLPSSCPFVHTYAWLFYQHLPKITHRSLVTNLLNSTFLSVFSNVTNIRTQGARPSALGNFCLFG